MAFTVGQLEIQLIADVARLQRDMDKMQSSVGRATKNVNSSIATSVASFKSLIGAVGIGGGVLGLSSALIKSIDSYTRFNAILKQSTASQNEFAVAQTNVIRIAKAAQTEVSSIGLVYARFSNNLKDLGTTQEQISTLTETLTLALKVNGATTEETSSAMLQMSQAFGKGKLDGDEFRTAMEAMPNVMRVLAESMGVPFGALKDLAAEGQITSEVLLKAFTDKKLLDSYRKNAKEVETIGGAWTNVTSAITSAIGELDRMLNMSGAIKGFLNMVATAIGPAQEGSLLERAQSAQLGALGKQSTAKLKAMAGFGGLYKQAYEARVAQEAAAGNKLGGSGAVTSGTTLFPNFNVVKKEGTGGYDARENNTKQLEDARNLAKERAELAKELAAKQRKLDEDAFDFQMSLINTWNKLEDKQQKEQYETQIKWMELEQKRANENFKAAQEANKQLEDERRKEADKTSDEISKSIADALYRGFEKGYSFLDNFVATLKNTFKTMVLQPIIKFLVDSSGLTAVLGALGSVFSGSASASSGGGNSIGSVFGGLKDAISAGNGSIVSSIQDLGVFLSTGNGGLGDTLGGFIGQYSAQIANVLPYTGAFLQALSGDVKGAAFTAAGTAIGSIWGPIGGAIGGALGSLVGGLFGGEDYDRFGTQVGGISSGVGNFRKTSESVIYDKPLTGTSSVLNDLNKAFLETAQEFLSSFGVNSTIAVTNALYQRGKSGKSGGTTGISIDGKYLGRSDVVLKDADMKQVYEALVNQVFGVGLVKVIKASSLPDGIKKFFDGLTKKEDVLEVVNTLSSLNKALIDLPAVFNAVRNAIDTTAYDTTIEQLKAQFQATHTFVSLFYSDTEQFDIFTKQLITQFNELNQTIPTSRDQYRALVESINVVDEATRDQFNALIALAPAMDEYFNLLQQQADGINEVNQALADGLDARLFSTYADYASGKANVYAGNSASDFMANKAAANDQVIQELKDSNAEMKVYLQAIVQNTLDTARIQKRWNGDGLPAERVVTA